MEQSDKSSDSLEELSDNVSDMRTMMIFIVIFILLNTVVFSGYLIFMFMNGSN